MITAAIVVTLLSLNAFAIYKIWQNYILFGMETEANALIEKPWKFVKEDCLNLNDRSLMLRNGVSLTVI